MTSKTILAEAGGFTPVIDAMIQDVGLLTAIVFGKAWRYCQMADGVCYASTERMAEELGIKRSTVSRHLRVLVQSGYLADVTGNLTDEERSDPAKRRRTRTYADTGKAKVQITITASVADSSASVAQNNRSVAVGNKVVAQGNRSVAESDTKIVLREKDKKEKKTAAAKSEDAAAATDFPLIQANRTALQTAGIRGKRLETLAALPHMTPELVSRHQSAWREENQAAMAAGRELKGIPILILRLETNEPMAGDGLDANLTPRQMAVQRDPSLRGYTNRSGGRGAGGVKIGREPSPFKIPSGASVLQAGEPAQ